MDEKTESIVKKITPNANQVDGKNQDLAVTVYLDGEFKNNIETKQLVKFINLFNPMFYAQNMNNNNFRGVSIILDIDSESSIKSLDKFMNLRDQIKFTWLVFINLKEEFINDNYIKE